MSFTFKFWSSNRWMCGPSNAGIVITEGRTCTEHLDKILVLLTITRFDRLAGPCMHGLNYSPGACANYGHFTRLTVLFVLMDERAKNGGVPEKKSGGITVTVATYTRRLGIAN